METLRERIEADTLFLDSGIMSHGFAPYSRDYDIVIRVPAARPDLKGSYIASRLRYRFTHCTEAHVATAVRGDVWKKSWADEFIDYQRWEQAGEPEGWVWGVGWSLVYPGLSHIAESGLARSWSDRLDREMHEVCVESGAFNLRLVCHDLTVWKLATGNPTTGELRPLDVIEEVASPSSLRTPTRAVRDCRRAP